MFITYFWVDSWLKLMAACTEQMQPLAAEGDARISMANELEQLRAALAVSETAVAAITRQRDEMQAELERVRRHAEEERTEFAQRQAASVSEAENRLQREAAGRTAARAEVEMLHWKLTEAEADAAKARAEAQRLQEKDAVLRMKAEDAAAEAKAQAEQAREKYRAVSKELKAVAAEAESARNENRRLAAEAAALESKVQQMSAEVETMWAKLNDAAATATAAQPAPAAEPAPTRDKLPAETRKPTKRTRKPMAAAAAQTPPANVELVMRFRKPDGWAEPVYMHYWGTDPAAAEPAWPGTAMTDEGDGWWWQRIDGVRTASLVFNDAAGNQTGNLHRDRPGRLDTDGLWIDE